MNKRLLAATLSFAAILATTTGCARDPEASKQRYLESGRQYFEKGKYSEASIEFRNALKVDPDFLEAYYQLGFTYLQLKNYRQAYSAFDAVVLRDPDQLEARLELAELLLLSRKSYDARAEIVAVQQIQPKNVRAQFLLAKSFLSEKDFEAAIEEFEKAKQLAPDQVLIWNASGLAKVAAKQYRGAEADFRNAIELNPSSAEAYRNLGNLFRLTGRQNQIESLLRQGVEANPRSLELHLALANFYFEQEQYDAIERLFAPLKARAGDFPDLLLRLGDFWMWRSELARAVAEYEATLETGPHPLAERKLISAYITHGRWEEAEARNQKLLARNAEDLNGRAFRGALRHLRGDSSGALVDLRAVLEEVPHSPFANYYLGLALMAQNRLKEAETAFLECLKRNDQFAEAFGKLAEIRMERGDGELGIQYAQKMVSLTRQQPAGYLLLAQAFLYQGDARRAEQVLNRLRTIAPDSAVVQELLGSAYLLQGKVTKGLQTYERAWEHSQQPVGSLSRFVDVFVAQGKGQQALKRVQRIIARDPQPGYYEILARLHLHRNDLKAAQAACREALRLNKSGWVAHFYLAQIAERLHHPEEALAHYNQVIQRQPGQTPPYILAGDIQLRRGAFDQARSYYEQAARQSPDSIVTQHSLARLWREEGSNLDEALTLMHGLQRKFPDDPNLADTVGWIYYGMGIYPAALAQLRRSVEQQPRNALFHYHLGMIYGKMGEAGLSRQSLESALRLGLNSSRWETAAHNALEEFSSQDAL